METTLFLAKIVGPVLLARTVSILIDRQHFEAMINGLEKEITTVAFSLFPIALMMTCIALTLIHRDTSSLAAIIFHIIAWGGIAKSTLLIIAPKLGVVKAQQLGKAGFLNVVCAVCLCVGGYLTWFGYFQTMTTA